MRKLWNANKSVHGFLWLGGLERVHRSGGLQSRSDEHSGVWELRNPESDLSGQLRMGTMVGLRRPGCLLSGRGRRGIVWFLWDDESVVQRGVWLGCLVPV